MQPQATLRGWQFDQLRRAVVMTRHIVQNAPPQALNTYRDGGTGWTVLEVLCHLRDWEQVFEERMRLTAEQEGAVMPNPDPDEAARERRYNEQDPAQALEAWAQQRGAVLDYLQNLDESAWERTATHPRRGVMTLMDQLLLLCWHDMNHMEQIVKILAQRQS